jgi:hypothetical protein
MIVNPVSGGIDKTTLLSELSSFHKIKNKFYRIKLQVQTTHKKLKLYMININQSVLLLRAVMEQLN